MLGVEYKSHSFEESPKRWEDLFLSKATLRSRSLGLNQSGRSGAIGCWCCRPKAFCVQQPIGVLDKSKMATRANLLDEAARAPAELGFVFDDGFDTYFGIHCRTTIMHGRFEHSGAQKIQMQNPRTNARWELLN